MSHNNEVIYTDLFNILIIVYFAYLVLFFFISLFFNLWIWYPLLLALGLFFIPLRQRARREILSVIKDCIRSNPMFSECVHHTMEPLLMSREEVDYWIGVYFDELLSKKSQTN